MLDRLAYTMTILPLPRRGASSLFSSNPSLRTINSGRFASKAGCFRYTPGSLAAGYLVQYRPWPGYTGSCKPCITEYVDSIHVPPELRLITTGPRCLTDKHGSCSVKTSLPTQGRIIPSQEPWRQTSTAEVNRKTAQKTRDDTVVSARRGSSMPQCVGVAVASCVSGKRNALANWHRGPAEPFPIGPFGAKLGRGSDARATYEDITAQRESEGCCANCCQAALCTRRIAITGHSHYVKRRKHSRI